MNAQPTLAQVIEAEAGPPHHRREWQEFFGRYEASARQSLFFCERHAERVRAIAPRFYPEELRDVSMIAEVVTSWTPEDPAFWLQLIDDPCEAGRRMRAIVEEKARERCYDRAEEIVLHGEPL